MGSRTQRQLAPVETFKADVSRSNIQTIYDTARLDLNAIDLRMQQSLGTVANQITKATATRRARFAGTGLAVGSKSFLATMSQMYTGVEREVDNVRTQAELARRTRWYAAQVQAMNAENQARGFDIAAIDVASRKAEQTARTFTGALTNIGKSLSAAGGLLG